MQVNAISNTNQNTSQVSANTTSNGNDFSSYLEASTAKTSTLSDIFNEASSTYGVPVSLLESVAKQESNFNPNATSHCGAMGVMQLMPSTAANLGVTNAYDAKQNIMGGAKYLSYMLQKYDGNVSYALAAYNAGSGNVAKYGGIPPFKETQNYVAKITSYMQNGVTLPDGTVSVSNAANSSTANVSDTNTILSVNNSASNTTNSDTTDSASDAALDRVFSYDDYLKFLDIYLKDIQTDSDTNDKEKEEENNKALTNYYAYQGIQFQNTAL